MPQSPRDGAQIQFTHRAPAKRVQLWDEVGVDPHGVDREIVECMHRTHIGVDNDYVNIILHGLRTRIADGWGGSMIATELQDVLFGAPQPVRSQGNLGVLKPDQVNIIVHGHEPILSEMIVAAAQDPEMVELGEQHGAKGIDVADICCTGNEVLMRHGIPIAGSSVQQELAVITGACVRACYTEALGLGDEGTVAFDADKCTGCGLCLFVCAPTSARRARLPSRQQRKRPKRHT